MKVSNSCNKCKKVVNATLNYKHLQLCSKCYREILADPTLLPALITLVENND